MRRPLTILTAMLVAACVVAPSTAEPRAHGTAYVLPAGFVVPLDSGEQALLSVAVVFTADSERAWLTGAEQARVHRLVLATVRPVAGRRLLSPGGRRAVAARLGRAIRATGLPVEAVLIPDLAVRAD